MGRALSLLVSRLPSFEEDGITHLRDCACARCDAGFGPGEQERAEAHRRWEEKQAQAAAERVVARRREAERVKRAERELFVSAQERITDLHLQSLRGLEQRVRTDPRLEELWRLRRRGMSLRESMAEIDRRFSVPDPERGGAE